MYQLLRSRIEGLREPCLTFAQELVRTPSVTCQESAVADLVEREMDGTGFDQVLRDDYGNVVGVFHGREAEPTVLLICHLDTVPAGDEKEWEHDPHAGRIEGGRLCGLGAGDCKGGLAGIVYAASALKRSLLPLRGNLVVAATVAEEQGGSVGVRGLLEQTLPELELTPTAAILGEPTGLGLYYGHGGWLELEIVVEGADAARVHGAAWAIFETIGGFERRTRRRGVPEALVACPPAFEESRATIRLDRRLRQAEAADEVLGEVRHHAALAAGIARAGESSVGVEVSVREEKRCLYTGRTTTIRRITNSWATDPFDPLVESARRSLAAAGCGVRTGTWQLGRLGMGTAGSVLVEEFGIPTVGYGPGDESVVHAPNEWVSTEAVIEAAYGTAAVVHGLVGIPVLGWASGGI